jgi:biopolymer transport protein ExbB
VVIDKAEICTMIQAANLAKRRVQKTLFRNGFMSCVAEFRGTQEGNHMWRQQNKTIFSGYSRAAFNGVLAKPIVEQSGTGQLRIQTKRRSARRHAICFGATVALVLGLGAMRAAAQSGESSIAIAALPQDLSPWGMFLHADTIVKTVMIGLAFASLVTWTIWVAKSIELLGARAAVRRGLRVLAESASLAQAHEKLRSRKGPVGQLIREAANEIRLSANLRADGLKERIAWQSERIEMAAGRKISRGTGILATIGATAPFVGLFGTVWGIMDSFIGISKAHTTNLAVVAPGIAEALLATALGLVAAIPAVMIYNVLARSTTHYRALIGDAATHVLKLVSRDLDRAQLPLSHAAE